MLNRLVWKKGNLKFFYYDGLGHALDRRSDIHDLVFKPADKAALADLAEKLSGL